MRDVAGWMTDAQARRLWDAAAALGPLDQIVEIGSFQGRSMIVLARAAAPGTTLVAIDPHGGTDRGPQEIRGKEAEAEVDHQRFHRNLDDAGVGRRVRHIRAFSDDALDQVDGTVDLLYIDGAHRWRPALSDITRWGARVPDGGRMLIHDSFSSVGVTIAQVLALFTSRRWIYEGRSGSLTQYRRGRFTGRERIRSLGAQTAQLGWFARNVAIKVLIVARLGRLTRLLGHDGTDWPY